MSVDDGRDPVFEPLEPREVVLTPRTRTGPEGAPESDPLSVLRYLPSRERRMVGAWCFVDYYGPDDIPATGGMRVPPHPHCGLQTVSWLFAGEIEHRDSLGSRQLIRPGQLNLMTSGLGISHAENSVEPHGPVLHGAQLWIALPAAHRTVAPAFEHHAALPVLDLGGVRARVLIGALGTETSPARAYTPLVGADLTISGPAAVPLRADWEYAVLLTQGAAEIDGRTCGHRSMAYLGGGRDALDVRPAGPPGSEARALLIGGEPFSEQLVMWWNFVAGSHQQIVDARADWHAGTHRFGSVDGGGTRLPAPPMPALTLIPRGRR